MKNYLRAKTTEIRLKKAWAQAEGCFPIYGISIFMGEKKDENVTQICVNAAWYSLESDRVIFFFIRPLLYAFLVIWSYFIYTCLTTTDLLSLNYIFKCLFSEKSNRRLRNLMKSKTQVLEKSAASTGSFFALPYKYPPKPKGLSFTIIDGPSMQPTINKYVSLFKIWFFRSFLREKGLLSLSYFLFTCWIRENEIMAV